MNKIYFKYTECFGEYSLFFSSTGKEYEYRTYDAYFAKDIIRIAARKPGTAWNKVKKYLEVYK